MDNKAKIISASIDIFAHKGKYGAKMEEIAAKVNDVSASQILEIANDLFDFNRLSTLIYT